MVIQPLYNLHMRITFQFMILVRKSFSHLKSEEEPKDTGCEKKNQKEKKNLN